MYLKIIIDNVYNKKIIYRLNNNGGTLVIYCNFINNKCKIIY